MVGGRAPLRHSSARDTCQTNRYGADLNIKASFALSRPNVAHALLRADGLESALGSPAAFVAAQFEGSWPWVGEGAFKAFAMAGKDRRNGAVDDQEGKAERSLLHTIEARKTI